MDLITIIIGSIFVNNYVFAQFLGICPALGVTQKLETSFGMGMAVTFVITLASIITYFIQKVLVKFNIEYLQTIAFILVIATLVQFVEMALKKLSPNLYNALGVYLPLITTNCVVLGVAILNVESEFNLIETIVNGISASIGFTIAIVALASIREKLQYADIPEALKGTPVALFSLGLMSVAFMGFAGLV